ncbi:MAG: hypothetical protein WC050_04810, partial [Candidatus Paceibacterota bacterium]
VGAAGLLAFVLTSPRQSGAEGLMGDMQCIGLQCPCGMGPGPNGPCSGAGAGKIGCTCMDVTSGFPTTGTCVSAIPPKCKATATSGPNGFGLDILKQMLGGLMQQLMKGGSGGGGGGDSGGGGAPGTNPGCTQYYQVSTPTSDPCAYYVPSISSTLTDSNSTSNLTNLLNSFNATDTNSNTNSNIDLYKTPTSTASSTVSLVSTTTRSGTTTIINLFAGLRGDIQVGQDTATVLAGNRSLSTNSEVSGFYGRSGFNVQSQNVTTQLCQARPWASNFLSTITPSAFFDGLCALRGYKAGAPVPAPQTVAPVKTPPKAAATSTGPVLPPEVDIWAVPATVTLGSRTSIFWSSQGVDKCTETSPDGSFSQSIPAGNASTVALYGATTFTITCFAPDGSAVSKKVTVNLSR